jgi:hypothetical protein
MDTPRRINYEALKGFLESKKEGTAVKTGTGIVRESDLIKVGGLYRIRDNYEAIWRMEAGEDGKRYIVRADEGGETAPERLLVTSESAPSDSAKAAYKVIHAGAVYVAWECEACATPNLTKFGNGYECDECHKRYADVLRTEDQQRQDKQTYTRAEVEVYSPEFARRMGSLGINVAHRSLLAVWERDAFKCPACDDLVEDSAKEKHKSHCPGKKTAKHNVCTKCWREYNGSECPSCNKKEGAKSDWEKRPPKGMDKAIWKAKLEEWRKEREEKDDKKDAAKAVNPWAVCHESVGPEKSDKFERCVKDVKKKSPIKE